MDNSGAAHMGLGGKLGTVLLQCSQQTRFLSLQTDKSKKGSMGLAKIKNPAQFQHVFKAAWG